MNSGSVPKSALSETTEEPLKVLIADNDPGFAGLGEFLLSYGFATKFAGDGTQAKSLIKDWKPQFVIADLDLAQAPAMEVVRFVKGDASLAELVRVIITSSAAKGDKAQACLDEGAVDFITKPINESDLLKRLVFLARTVSAPRSQETSKVKLDESSHLLHLAELMLRQSTNSSNSATKLFRLTQMIALRMDAVRCSLVQCPNTQNATVVSSNDDPKASGIVLDLAKYPEIVHVMNTETTVAIESIDENKHLKSIRNLMKGIVFSSMIVSPVKRRDQFFGVLSIRMKFHKKSFSEHEIRFIQVAAHVMSHVLNEAQLTGQAEFWKAAA